MVTSSIRAYDEYAVLVMYLFGFGFCHAVSRYRLHSLLKTAPSMVIVSSCNDCTAQIWRIPKNSGAVVSNLQHNKDVFPLFVLDTTIDNGFGQSFCLM